LNSGSAATIAARSAMAFMITNLPDDKIGSVARYSWFCTIGEPAGSDHGLPGRSS
jgi:hypothetical protein